MKNEKIDIENLQKENIFRVPENYFNELPMRIQAQTTGRKKYIPLISWSKKRTWASITACAIILILGYFTLMPQQDSIGSESLSEVQNHEIENYLMQENINQSDIAEQIDKNKTIIFQDSELLDNLKVTDNDISQSVDYEHFDSDI